MLRFLAPDWLRSSTSSGLLACHFKRGGASPLLGQTVIYSIVLPFWSIIYSLGISALLCGSPVG